MKLFKWQKKVNSNIPTFDELLIPTIQALQEPGGSGSIEEINGKVYEIAKIHDDILQIPHGEDGTINEVDYRLAWSRTYLKKFGLLENSSRGIWALSQADINISKLNPDEIKRTVREQTRPAINITKARKNKTVKLKKKLNLKLLKTGSNNY
ncbi:winged helix-turn-helix domain-containing protein [Parafilimonas sp.]|uniref:winged helix-turn-helix domain-containing protein n=1 Tax=Parafilimonas sp. TaxID=1969739 RepID=UPI0039E46DEC